MVHRTGLRLVESPADDGDISDAESHLVATLEQALWLIADMRAENGRLSVEIETMKARLENCAAKHAAKLESGDQRKDGIGARVERQTDQ